MMQKGFTIFVAIMVTGTLTLIAMGIIALVVRQSTIATSARASQAAFYAADTGAECAIYWDAVGQAGVSAFATTSSITIQCNHDSAANPNNSAQRNLSNQFIIGHNTSNPGYAVSTFGPIHFYPNQYCAQVTVYKYDNNTTQIESKGYNTCDTTDPRRVERAVKVNY